MVFLLFFLWIGILFTDLPLSIYIGTIGSSLMFILSPVVFLLFLYNSGFKIKRRFDIDLFLYYFLITFIVSILLFVYYFISHKEIYTPYGELIPLKLVKASFYNFVYFILYYNLAILFEKIPINRINKIFLFTFVFLVIIGAIEFLDKNLLNVFHKNIVDYSRLRLLTAEPSRAFYMFISFGLLSLLIIKTKLFKFIIFLTMFIGIILIASKGGIIFLFLSVFIVYFFSTNLKQKIILSFVFIPILILGIYIFVQFILPQIVIDIEKFTSFSTRLTTSLWAFLSLFHFPFGEGYGTYLCYFQDLLKMAQNYIEQIFPIKLSYLEINSMISTGKNVGVKSGLLFQVVQNGIIAIICFYLLFVNSYKKIEKIRISIFQKIILKIIIVYTFLTVLLGANIEVLYVYILPIVYINTLYYKEGYLLYE